MRFGRSVIVVTILALSIALLSKSVNAIEQPKFELVEEIGNLEIRKYQAHIVAKTLVDGSFEDAGKQGFKRLAGYIFGGNGQDQKIAMTAPVELMPDVDSSSDSQYWITFSMPSKYAMQDLPTPNDSRIEITEVPARYLAVLRYKGSWSEERYRTHESSLLSLISKNAAWLKQGKPSWSRYDPPFVPWFMRTNEVSIEVILAE